MDQSTEKMICNPCNKERIELGIDGDHAFALLGEDIQSGWSAFVKMEKDCSCSGDWCLSHKVVAAKRALAELREAIGCPTHPFYFGKSHPYGEG